MENGFADGFIAQKLNEQKPVWITNHIRVNWCTNGEVKNKRF
jgi:hypothetical protein